MHKRRSNPGNKSIADFDANPQQNTISFYGNAEDQYEDQFDIN